MSNEYLLTGLAMLGVTGLMLMTMLFCLSRSCILLFNHAVMFWILVEITDAPKGELWRRVLAIYGMWSWACFVLMGLGALVWRLVRRRRARLTPTPPKTPKDSC